MGFYTGKRVLVTGGTGLIGSHIAERLANEGALVRATLHSSRPATADPRISYVQADLTRREDCLRATEGVDFVFMCAANTSGAAVMASNPVAHVTTNLMINSQMLEAAYLAKVDRFLFVSSTTAYPPVTHPVKEHEAFDGDPHDSYLGVGWMKRYIEKLAQFYYVKFGLKIAILRPTNVYGPRDKFDFATSHVLPALIRRAVEKQNPFEVWGDGSAVRDFIYVDDMVDATLVALERCANNDPINLGSGEAVTIKESVEAIIRLTGHSEAKVIFDPSKPTTIPIRLVDLTKARQLLDYRPKVTFEEGLRRTIDWYRSTLPAGA
jgi:GDP-L-fucose synthase